jgi:glycine oxidase
MSGQLARATAPDTLLQRCERIGGRHVAGDPTTLRRMRASDAIVIGGGVIGCSTAWELARAGAEVVLIERDSIAAHASGAAAGMLAPIVEAGAGGPWLELGLRAQAELVECCAELREVTGIDPELARCGALRIAREPRAAELRATAAQLGALDCEWLGADELYKREPQLAPGFAGALWSPREACLDAALLTRAFAAAAEHRGARILPGVAAHGLLSAGERICGVRTSEGDLAADAVVLCTGAWAGASAAWTGAALPVEPIKGQMLAIESPVPAPRSILWGEGAYLVPRPDGSLRVGATVERAGFDARPTAGGLAALLEAAAELLPDTRRCRFLRTWAGLRPATPDHLPLVGALPARPGAWLAVGHHRNGILLSALTARALAQGILSGRWPPGLEALDPKRF